MSKCNICNGCGFVSIGDGIRGIKQCPACLGKGYLSHVNDEKLEVIDEDDKKQKFIRRLSECVQTIGGAKLLDYKEVIELVEELL